MNQQKSLVIFFCLISICGFGKESLELLQKDISVRIPEESQLVEVDSEELSSENETAVLQSMTEDDLKKEISYLLEESNFEEVFGSNP